MNRRLSTVLLPLMATLPVVASWSGSAAERPLPGPANVLLTVERFLEAVDRGDVEAASLLVAVPTTVGFAARLDGDESLSDMRETPMGAWFDMDLAGRPENHASPDAFVESLTTLPVNTELRHEVRQGIAHCASELSSAGILEIDRVILRAGEEVMRRTLRVTVDLHWKDGRLRIHSWHASERASALSIPPMPPKEPAAPTSTDGGR